MTISLPPPRWGTREAMGHRSKYLRSLPELRLACSLIQRLAFERHWGSISGSTPKLKEWYQRCQSLCVGDLVVEGSTIGLHWDNRGRRCKNPIDAVGYLLAPHSYGSYFAILTLTNRTIHWSNASPILAIPVEDVNDRRIYLPYLEGKL